MEKYPIKNVGVDFSFKDEPIVRGSREKRLVVTSSGEKAMFKYERDNYICSEACSEKLAYEIAKILGYNCARIELAYDMAKRLGVLNYYFVDTQESTHMDIVSYLNINSNDRKSFYTISNIKAVLDDIDKGLFIGFIKIMIFDALIGEQDRHEENWGISEIDGKYFISPLYDNGDSLLRDFYNVETAQKYYNKVKDFHKYIRRSKTWIYKDNHQKRFKHFELVQYLCEKYPQIVNSEINNLNNLTDDKIEKVVNMLPDDLLTEEHKKYIIMYLIERRNILLDIK